MSTKEDIKRKKCNDEKKDYNEKTGRCIKKKQKNTLVINDAEEDLDIEEVKPQAEDINLYKVILYALSKPKCL